jgi:hypothetical protein
MVCKKIKKMHPVSLTPHARSTKSGAQGVLFDEKTGSKIPWHCPFKRGDSLPVCKMRSADFPEPAATYQQNLFMCRSSAPYLSSVTLIYARPVSVKLNCGIHVLQRQAKPECWRKPIVRILAWWTDNYVSKWHDAVKFCHTAIKSADPILHWESFLLKKCSDATGNFKNQSGVGIPYCSSDLIYHLK